MNVKNKYDLKLLVKILSLVYRNTIRDMFTYSKDIENKFNIKKSFISSLLSELEQDGLIYRESSGKRKKISITEMGISKIKKCIFQLLSDEEIQILSKRKIRF